jgi:predicted membrane protein
MTAVERFRITPRLIVGLAILVLGALWTLDNLNLLESEDFTDWWPVVLIAIGLVKFLGRRTNRVGPVLLMIVGALLLTSSLGYIHFDLGDLIPLAFAAWGAKLVWDALSRRSVATAGVEQGDATVHAFAMMAGVRWHSASPTFRGGDASAIMGGVEIDLRNAQLAAGEEVVIDALALMGGVEIVVPSGWRIVANVLPIMGAFEDNTVNGSDSGPALIVRGTAVMGSIEVKN